MKKAKKITFVMILVVLALCVVGTTLAWLTAQSEEVENTFTVGNVGVGLKETDAEGNTIAQQSLKMVPGWTMDKNPKAWVTAGSEDCYLFVEITPTNGAITKDDDGIYHLGDYVVYAVEDGWAPLAEGNVNVFYKIIDEESEMGEGENKYNILGAGTYVDPMNQENANDDVTVTWTDNQVATKPSVTKEDMEVLTEENYPKLTFKAYAVQLWKTNKPADGATAEAIAAAQFTAAEAWGLAQNSAQQGN